MSTARHADPCEASDEIWTVDYFHELGCEYVHRPAIGPGGQAPGRNDYSQVMFAGRLQGALQRIVMVASPSAGGRPDVCGVEGIAGGRRGTGPCRNATNVSQYAAAHPDSRWKMPAHWYRLDLPVNAPLVTVLVLDSNYESLSDAEWADQMGWLAAELRKPRTTSWLIVAAHHPLHSDGRYGDDAFLETAWGELFERHAVDFYLCGHDHNLQHLRQPPLRTDFVISGGGGRSTRDLRPGIRGPFGAGIHGFAHLRLSAQAADVRLVDKDGRIVHAFSRSASKDVLARLSGLDAAPVVTSERARE